MTHYNIDYSGLEPDEKYKKALEDIKDYMGADKFDELTEAFRAEGKMPEGRFHNYVSLAGVSGYPAVAWYNYIYAPKE